MILLKGQRWKWDRINCVVVEILEDSSFTVKNIAQISCKVVQNIRGPNKLDAIDDWTFGGSEQEGWTYLEGQDNVKSN
jgi:hypothetical protein